MIERRKEAGLTRTPHAHEKAYSLEPEDSIKFDNKFAVLPGLAKDAALVELSLTNTMKYPAVVSRFTLIDSAHAKNVEVLGFSNLLVIPKRATYKFLVKYEVGKDFALVRLRLDSTMSSEGCSSVGTVGLRSLTSRAASWPTT